MIKWANSKERDNKTPLNENEVITLWELRSKDKNSLCPKLYLFFLCDSLSFYLIFYHKGSDFMQIFKFWCISFADLPIQIYCATVSAKPFIFFNLLNQVINQNNYDYLLTLIFFPLYKSNVLLQYIKKLKILYTFIPFLF